ncbi:zinc-dependent alcohol dehydrogenase family protein [Rosenbergiella nectarea]|uniref:zinc-dependent alcohol dehydrogenase family protein n=1 Tax=Rosenbergiella nectarea TaxID=988801 RepID=UPI001F4D8975|nr:zinc-dependent alcohol dehydrogenase family protein [Rosenbergiella nectarea]
MPQTVLFDAFGDASVMRKEQISSPEPGPGEVRLRIRAIGINRAEILFRAGQYVGDPDFPSQLGYEAAGEIEAVGPDVADWFVGDRVSVIPAFAIDAYGLYGEVSLAPARALVAVPDNMDWTHAAAVWMQYGTAWGGLIQKANLRAGETVLIPAASGSVGLAAIQIAKMVGAKPVALTRRADKSSALLAAGAAAVIVTEEQDLVTEVMKLTDGKGADVAFDPVGGPAFTPLLEAIAIGGRVVIYGSLSPEATTLPLVNMMLRDITLRAYAFAFEMHQNDKIQAMKNFVLPGLISGELSPVIARTFDFNDLPDAHHYLEQNAHIGKVVVTVDPGE